MRSCRENIFDKRNRKEPVFAPGERVEPQIRLLSG